MSNYRSDDGFDHSTCHGRNLPPCTTDAGHGHSATFFAAQVSEGVDKVVFACKTCGMKHMAHLQMGPLAMLVVGPDPVDEVLVAKGMTPDEAEQVMIENIAEFPDDEACTSLLDEFRTTRALVEAQRAADANIEIVSPMNAGEFSRLMAASPVNPYRPNMDDKETN